jgi:predicted short-subunit dehydrogenase-like oxidoreductase (DUF2520 family)
VHFTVIGAGRLGQTMAPALRAAGATVIGPLGRGGIPEPGQIVLLCVPEPALATVSATIPAGCIVGHCSASAPLDDLAPHERFFAHPLLPFTKSGAEFSGAACAIDGNTPRAIDAARNMATLLGMHAVKVPADRRALYHAAASMAANFLVTLEWAAERLAAPCDITRADLAPVVRASMENWLKLGGGDALTGPLSRGDTATVARQRAAVADSAPDLLPLWDALANATAALVKAR